MPVLARRSSETISLPEIGVSMRVLNVVGNRIRIALQVPENVIPLSPESETATAGTSTARGCTRLLSRQEFHDLKNDLHAIRLTLHVFHRQTQANRIDAATATFDRVKRQVRSLQDLLPPDSEDVKLPSLPHADITH